MKTAGWFGIAVLVTAGVALIYVLGQPGTVVDGRVYGPDVTIPAALLGAGALVVGAAGARPFEARLARLGMAGIALGALAVIWIKLAEASSNPMAGLVPLVIAIACFLGGGVAIAFALVRARD